MKTKSAVIATAAAALFAGAMTISTANAANVKCTGANACKGMSACKTASSACKGMNACKGMGFVETASAQECSSKGGKTG